MCYCILYSVVILQLGDSIIAVCLSFLRRILSVRVDQREPTRDPAYRIHLHADGGCGRRINLHRDRSKHRGCDGMGYMSWDVPEAQMGFHPLAFIEGILQFN